MTSFNFINPQTITNYLNQQAEGNEQVAGLLNSALRNSLHKRSKSAIELKNPPENAPPWLTNKWDTCGPFYEFTPDTALTDKVQHIKDWLVSAQQNNETVNLAGFNLESTWNAANRYFAVLNKKSLFLTENNKDTETVMNFNDGSKIVKLLTPTALKYEGTNMGNCLGGKAYEKKLGSADQ